MDLDLRAVREGDRVATVLRAYDGLDVGGSVVVSVDDGDLDGVRDAFDVEHPGSHAWEALGPGRARVTKRASTPLPRVLCDTSVMTGDQAGALWRLPMRERDLDANVVQLPPGGRIEPHIGADLDVLVVVLEGSGVLTTELDELEVRAGQLLWLPRGSRRGFWADREGLRYLTVHQRRTGLGLVAARP